MPIEHSNVSWHYLFVLYGGSQIRSPNRTNGEVEWSWARRAGASQECGHGHPRCSWLAAPVDLDESGRSSPPGLVESAGWHATSRCSRRFGSAVRLTPGDRAYSSPTRRIGLTPPARRQVGF